MILNVPSKRSKQKDKLLFPSNCGKYIVKANISWFLRCTEPPRVKCRCVHYDSYGYLRLPTYQEETQGFIDFKYRRVLCQIVKLLERHMLPYQGRCSITSTLKTNISLHHTLMWPNLVWKISSKCNKSSNEPFKTHFHQEKSSNQMGT